MHRNCAHEFFLLNFKRSTSYQMNITLFHLSLYCLSHLNTLFVSMGLFHHSLSGIRAWLRNHTHNFPWNAITHPWHKFDDGLSKTLLKLWPRSIITPTVKHGCHYLSMPLINSLCPSVSLFPYNNIEQCQQCPRWWIVAGWHQAITRTKVTDHQ